MQCTHPHIIWDKVHHEYIEVPCRVCMACRLNYTKEWAIRCMNEATCHDKSCFITLTYDDEHFPKDGNLIKSDLQKFFKRLRKRLEPAKIKYLACGEYGGQFGRPHYHAVIFGWFPEDAYIWRNRKVNPTYRSELLEEEWPFGMSEVGSLTYNSARYVASYVVKQHRGKDKVWYDENFVVPEFVVMSNGIGKEFCNKYKNQLKALGYLTFQGHKVKLPRYYEDKIYITEEEKEVRRNDKRKANSQAIEKFERSINYQDYDKFNNWYHQKFGRFIKWFDWLGRKKIDARNEREKQLQRMVNRKKGK